MSKLVRIEGHGLQVELWAERADGLKLKLRDLPILDADVLEVDLREGYYLVVKAKP